MSEEYPDFVGDAPIYSASLKKSGCDCSKNCKCKKGCDCTKCDCSECGQTKKCNCNGSGCKCQSL